MAEAYSRFGIKSNQLSAISKNAFSAFQVKGHRFKAKGRAGTRYQVPGDKRQEPGGIPVEPVIAGQLC
jgi:hypothetical protein